MNTKEIRHFSDYGFVSEGTMAWDDKLPVVKTLTKAVLGVLAPQKLASFEEQFAPFILAQGAPQVQERVGLLKNRDQGLDTTLVAGMFFQVLVEAEQLPAGTAERVSYVRKRAKNYLVNRLAGQISMSQFFRLLNLIDDHVQQYFAHFRSSWTSGSPGLLSPAQPSPDPIKTEALQHDLALVAMEPRGRRKLTQEKLLEFLLQTRGNWFKLLDFETHLQVNKKTAWACLNQLLEEGILIHNGEKANKARYILASRFRHTDKKMS
jgi:hypothetical protein